MHGVATERTRAEPAQQEAPHNLEAEEYLVGALMLPNCPIDRIAETLRPTDFWRESHGRIYSAALELHHANRPVDAITLADHLAATGRLENIGGKERLRELATLVPAVTTAPHHAEIVAKLSGFRALLTGSERIKNLAFEGGDLEHSITQAAEIMDGILNRGTTALPVETWHEFESRAHDDIPCLVDGLWPEAALGFIAAPPKKGKTWVALALAVAVATGRPLFGEYQVPRAQPVLYVALEGHRAALRARVGAIARGMGVNPDGDELDHLHFIYKPAGINLAEATWAQRLRRAADHVDAALTIVDVLRAGARIKENDQGEFTNLRHNLQPINDDGRSLALLHHFVKLSEISKERDPGERMSGSGAMFGALDAAIYITGSQNHATELRLAFDLRDLATPEDITIVLEGDGTGPGGGYGYRDTATWSITEDAGPDEDDIKAPPAEIYDWLVEQGGTALARDIQAHFEIAPTTLTRRLGRLLELGAEYTGGRGKPARLTIATDDSEDDAQTTLDVQPTESSAHGGTSSDGLNISHNQAENAPESSAHTSSAHEPMVELESGDLQGESSAHDHPPFGSAPARAHARRNPARLAEQETWVDQEGWLEDDPLAALITRYPNLTTNDLQRLARRAFERAAAEAGGS